jgi:hypothetical protein
MNSEFGENDWGAWKGLRESAQGFSPEFHRQIGKRRILEKHCLWYEWKQAYATLRRRVAAVVILFGVCSAEQR